MRKWKQIFAFSICLQVSAASAPPLIRDTMQIEKKTLKEKRKTLISQSASHVNDDLEDFSTGFLKEIEFDHHTKPSAAPVTAVEMTLESRSCLSRFILLCHRNRPC